MGTKEWQWLRRAEGKGFESFSVITKTYMTEKEANEWADELHYTLQGRCMESERLRKVKKEGWINLYLSKNGSRYANYNIFDSKENASAVCGGHPVITLKIEWEE